MDHTRIAFSTELGLFVHLGRLSALLHDNDFAVVKTVTIVLLRRFAVIWHATLHPGLAFRGLHYR